MSGRDREMADGRHIHAAEGMCHRHARKRVDDDNLGIPDVCAREKTKYLRLRRQEMNGRHARPLDCTTAACVSPSGYHCDYGRQRYETAIERVVAFWRRCRACRPERVAGEDLIRESLGARSHTVKKDIYGQRSAWVDLTYKERESSCRIMVLTGLETIRFTCWLHRNLGGRNRGVEEAVPSQGV